MRTTKAITRACLVVGGQAELARAVGVSPGAVNQWCKGIRAVPAERCPLVERATRGLVRCEEMRPDIAWSVLRQASQQAA